MGRLWNWVSEQWVESFGWTTITGIRSTFRNIGTKFWPNPFPAGEGTVVNYAYCRQLYRNSGENRLGAGFAKPIVNLQVAFIGIPTASTDNENRNDFMNECLHNYWTQEIQELIRDAIRDSKVIVRVRRPDVIDPLMTLDEAEHCSLEVLPPERVEIERNLRNKKIIEKAIIHHRVLIITQDGDPTMGIDPIVEEHQVLEIITKRQYQFFDQNTHSYMPELASENRDNLVPVVEIDNEYDSSLQGGQSDLESVIPFIEAFHDLLTQGLQAHKYHSTPKLKIKLTTAVETFIKNNFGETAIDPTTGAMKQDFQIPWAGREIFFFQGDEDAEFLEAVSVLGDTKTLLDFIIDCIAIASETPEWAFMRVDSGSANSDRNAQTVPFLRKIERKRKNFMRPIQELLKIALVMNDQIPIRAQLSWDVVRPDDQMVMMQAFQQLVMGLEVAKQSGEISDETYQRMLRVFLPVMKNPQKESAAIPPVPTIPVTAPAAPAPKPAQITRGGQGANN